MKMKDSVYKEHSYTGRGRQTDVEVSVLLLLPLFLVQLVGWWVGLGARSVLALRSHSPLHHTVEYKNVRILFVVLYQILYQYMHLWDLLLSSLL